MIMECINYESILSYISNNVSQISLLLVLIYVTIYRKEMSCNSDYHDDDDDFRDDKDDTKQKITSSTLMRHNHSYTSLSSFNSMEEDKIQKFSMTSSPLVHAATTTSILELTPELQIQCLTYLHPRDVISLGCCNKLSYHLIHGDFTTTTTTNERDPDSTEIAATSFSDMLWYHLWTRDYATIVHEWNIAQDALKQSLLHIVAMHMNQRKKKKKQKKPIQRMMPLILLSNLPSSSFPECTSKDTFISTFYNSSKDDTTATTATTTPTMKEFYLIYSQIWLNYTIAGHSTFQSCYTGLHGHIFNITNFLTIHPGAPETILLQGGGRDSTPFFESVGHSLSARKIAVRELVEVVDLGCCSSLKDGDVGLHDNDSSGGENDSNDDHHNSENDGFSKNKRENVPTKSKKKSKNSNQMKKWPLAGLSSTVPSNLSLLPKRRSRPKRTMGTLYDIRQKLKQSEKNAQSRARKIESKGLGMIGKLNLYFDPFDGRWHGWYLNSDFDVLFVHNLEE